jgi:TetR/AcrR family transcriptional repressor of nem operon
MGKGEETRQKILEEATHLFNTKGYQNTSFRDLTLRTGVQKGGIYNHFANKEQLALESFELAMEKIRERARQILQGQPHTLDRIKGVVKVFQSLIETPVVEGGCPILNASVEADDTDPLLLSRSRAAMDEIREYIIRSVTKGQARSEIQPHVNPQTLATVVLSALEGAIMMSKLYDDLTYMTEVADYMNAYLDSLRME